MLKTQTIPKNDCGVIHKVLQIIKKHVERAMDRNPMFSVGLWCTRNNCYWRFGRLFGNSWL